MEVGKLSVKLRKVTGKGEMRRMRAKGLVPGICYGAALEKPVAITLDVKALRASLDPAKRHNSVIDVTIDRGDEGPSQTVPAMLRDYQIHPQRRVVTHVDLVALDTNKFVEVEVPVELTGKAPGTVLGGTLHVVRHSLHVRCKPVDIPAKLNMDVSGLDIGGVLHISDLHTPEGVECVDPPRLTIVTCVAATVDESPAAGESSEDEAKDAKK